MAATDCGGDERRVEGFRAGRDLNMPGGSAYMEKAVLAAMKSGTLPERFVDDSVRRVLGGRYTVEAGRPSAPIDVAGEAVSTPA